MSRKAATLAKDEILRHFPRIFFIIFSSGINNLKRIEGIESRLTKRRIESN